MAHPLDGYSQFIGVTAFEEKQVTHPENYQNKNQKG